MHRRETSTTSLKTMPHMTIWDRTRGFQVVDELTGKDVLNESPSRATKGERVLSVAKEGIINVPEICFSDSTETSGFSSLAMDSALEANGFMSREVTSVFGECTCNLCFSGDPV